MTDQDAVGALERVMVDIETLGLEPGSAILSIGAVTFSEDGLGDEYYREISLKSCEAAGLEIDVGTLEWWLEQDDSLRDVLTGGGALKDVLREFSDWMPDNAEVWANSPSFDCDLLEAAFDAVGMSAPWHFRDERDFRTIQTLSCAVELEMEGDAHDALDDAKYQARIVGTTLLKLQAETNTEVAVDAE